LYPDRARHSRAIDAPRRATKWLAEQALRPAVADRESLRRQRTQNGASAQGVLISVLRTLAQKSRGAMDFLA